MDISVRADQPVKVTGKGTEDKVLMPGQAFTFTGVESLSVAAAPAEEVAPRPASTDVFDPSNRPNGAMTAAIAPKMPKSGGETRQEPIGGGQVVERAVAEVGRATQAGGPRSEDLKTPGPQPENASTAGTPQLGAATGDTDREGRPAARTTEQVSGKKGARKASRRR